MELSAVSFLKAEAEVTSSSPKKDSQIGKAAGDFEALLVSQLLKTARSEGGWLGSGEDQSAGSILEMGEEYLGQAIAGSGGLGLKKMIVSNLDAFAPHKSAFAKSSEPAEPDAPKP